MTARAPWEALFDAILSAGRMTTEERARLRERLAHADDATRAAAVRAAFQQARGRSDEAGRHLLATLESLVLECSGLLPRSAAVTEAAEAYFSPERPGRARLVQLLDGVRASLDVCVFTITDDAVADALIAAHGRQVRVRVISDDAKRDEPGSDVGRLERAGIPVLTDLAETLMHHKFAVLDGTTLVAGSYNWTRSAARRNQDDLLVLREPRLVAAFAGRFEELWRGLAADRAGSRRPDRRG